MGQNRLAVENLFKAHSLFPSNADILVKMGQGWLNLKETGRANEYLRKALKIQPENTEALILLSKIYESNGKIEEALNIL